MRPIGIAVSKAETALFWRKAQLSPYYGETSQAQFSPGSQSWLMKKLDIICCVRMKKYRSHKGEIGKTASNLLNRDVHSEKGTV